MNNSGIYKIERLDTKDFYIGSAINLRQRKNEHFSDLRLNKHPNKKLQNAFNKYGNELFNFQILATCPKEYLIRLEQWFIDTQKPYYNILKIAGSWLGNKHTKETKDKISKSRSMNIIGKKFFEMTVLSKINSSGHSYWLCKCDCGNIKSVRGSHLLAGNNKTCGCLRKRKRK